jgi:hypothetical protein
MVPETPEHKEERIRKRLEVVRDSVEQDIISTADITMKRLEVDAATVVTLSIIVELLPEKLQKHIGEIIRLHEEVWNRDFPPAGGLTPRKPLGRRLLEKFNF